MRKITITGALLIAAFPALATSGVSPRFDGRYRAEMTPVTGMGGSQCMAASIGPVVIDKGVIRMSDGDRSAGFAGFVTEEGFVTGHFTKNGKAIVFEGRFADDGFTGGVIDSEGGCAWVGEPNQPQLRRNPRRGARPVLPD